MEHQDFPIWMRLQQSSAIRMHTGNFKVSEMWKEQVKPSFVPIFFEDISLSIPFRIGRATSDRKKLIIVFFSSSGFSATTQQALWWPLISTTVFTWPIKIRTYVFGEKGAIASKLLLVMCSRHSFQHYCNMLMLEKLNLTFGIFQDMLDNSDRHRLSSFQQIKQHVRLCQGTYSVVMLLFVHFKW